ncbi:PREDICTED: uncharacterized protein LOC104620953, partial [Phaethon lepturus]|uniref:uncharacterized protein LOC104620953 n=1 Tax=Phaethon lepturus TaxID=97097 RepID=UPI00053095F5
LKMGRRSSDTEEENRSRRKKKHRRRSSSSSSSDSRTYSRKKSGRKSRSRSRSRDLQSRSHSYEKRRRHRSSSSSSYGSRRKRSRSRSRGRGKSYRSQRSRSKSRTRRSRSRPRQRSCSRSSERSSHRRTHSGSRERERRKGREKEKIREKGKGKEKEIYGTKHGCQKRQSYVIISASYTLVSLNLYCDVHLCPVYVIGLKTEDTTVCLLHEYPFGGFPLQRYMGILSSILPPPTFVKPSALADSATDDDLLPWLELHCSPNGLNAGVGQEALKQFSPSAVFIGETVNRDRGGRAGGSLPGGAQWELRSGSLLPWALGYSRGLLPPATLRGLRKPKAAFAPALGSVSGLAGKEELMVCAFSRGNQYLLLPTWGEPVLQRRATAVHLTPAPCSRDVGRCCLWYVVSAGSRLLPARCFTCC